MNRVPIQWKGFVKQVGFKPRMRVKELWMTKVVNQQRNMM